MLDNLLLYVTGGFAAAHFKNHLVGCADYADLQGSGATAGSAGFGIEWSPDARTGASSPRFSMPRSPIAIAPATLLARSTYNFRTVTWCGSAEYGLNYSWGGAPVVARYYSDG